MITVNVQINVVIMMEHVHASLDTMVKTVKIALKDTLYLMLQTVTKYVLVSILINKLSKKYQVCKISYKTFYITEYTCDEGFYTSIKETGVPICKGNKFNEYLTDLHSEVKIKSISQNLILLFVIFLQNVYVILWAQT